MIAMTVEQLYWTYELIARRAYTKSTFWRAKEKRRKYAWFWKKKQFWSGLEFPQQNHRAIPPLTIHIMHTDEALSSDRHTPMQSASSIRSASPELLDVDSADDSVSPVHAQQLQRVPVYGEPADLLNTALVKFFFTGVDAAIAGNAPCMNCSTVLHYRGAYGDLKKHLESSHPFIHRRYVELKQQKKHLMSLRGRQQPARSHSGAKMPISLTRKTTPCTLCNYSLSALNAVGGLFLE